MYIYLITNQTNQKCYIGQTIQKPSLRWRHHKANKKFSSLYNDIRLFGSENFTFEVILEAENQDELNKLEIVAIQHFQSTNSEKGYNIELGGNGKGKTSHVTKQKLSEMFTGSKNPFYGKKHTQESLDKMSKANIGRISSNKGKALSSETKEKLRISKIGIPNLKLRGRKFSDSTKEKFANNKAKYYIVTFPDGHEETIFNLTKFCRENSLAQGSMYYAMKHKNPHKGFIIKER